MNLSPLEHPRPIPVKPHNRSRPYVDEFNTTTRALIRWVRKLDRAAETIADAFIAAVMEDLTSPPNMNVRGFPAIGGRRSAPTSGSTEQN